MSVPLVQVTNFRFIHEAEAAKMFLEEAGIPAFIEDAETVTMDWLLGNAIGYIKLKVPEDRVADAAALLSDRLPELAAQRIGDSCRCLACEAELAEDEKACPKCGWTWALPRPDTAPKPNDC